MDVFFIVISSLVVYSLSGVLIDINSSLVAYREFIDINSSFAVYRELIAGWQVPSHVRGAGMT